MRSPPTARFVLTAVIAAVARATCKTINNCNGHGECVSYSMSCACYDGFGSATDVSPIKTNDCSKATCPAGKAWSDVPTSATQAHALAECSGVGLCNRESGACECFDGFEGDSCQRLVCPSSTAGECSGHGRCVSMKRMAAMSDAFPLSAPTTYTGAVDSTTWDEEMTYACVCDSGWTVGLGANERQLAEYFGNGCELKRCPSGDDPATVVDETDCSGVVAAGGYGTGASGNKCHVDCSNRGICDHTIGLCTCFPGYTGGNCGTYAGNQDGYVREIQSFVCTASGGTFTVTLGTATPVLVAWDADFATLTSALESLSTVIAPKGITISASGVQTVACAASTPDTIYVRFDRNYGDIDDLTFVTTAVPAPSPGPTSSGLTGTATITQNAAGTFTTGVAPSGS